MHLGQTLLCAAQKTEILLQHALAPARLSLTQPRLEMSDVRCDTQRDLLQRLRRRWRLPDDVIEPALGRAQRGEVGLQGHIDQMVRVTFRKAHIAHQRRPVVTCLRLLRLQRQAGGMQGPPYVLAPQCGRVEVLSEDRRPWNGERELP